MTKTIIARQFRGQTIYLVKADVGAKDFTWSGNIARAAKFVDASVVKRTLDGANEYGSEAYGIDSQGNVIVPAASAAVAKPLDELIPGFLEPNQQPQFQIENHGSITLFRPLNDAGREWLKRTAPEDAPFMGSAMAVEPSYVGDVADAILSDGGVLS